MPMACRKASLVWVLSLLLAISVPVEADTVALNPNHPERYTVVKGDTLWDISSRFLKDPWQWAQVWTINPQIKNPHLIYPGDVIVFTYINGKPALTLLPAEKLAPPAAAEGQAPGAPAAQALPPPPVPLGTVKLEPQVRAEPLKEAIPTISPEVIRPFLTQPLVVSRTQLEKAGYVTEGLDNRVALGDQSKFYARGLGKNPAHYYQVFRPSIPLKDPETGETLGYQATYLGDAELLAPGDPSKLVVTRVKEEILPTDRLVAVPEHQPPLPYYYPHAPKEKVHGSIIWASDAVNQFGPMTVVAISLGANKGMEAGDVLRIMHHTGKHLDPVTQRYYEIPDEQEGLLMVFRVFDKVSYALVMSASRSVRLYDTVRTP